MRSLLLMAAPPAACVLYLIGSLVMEVGDDLHSWMTYYRQYGYTLQETFSRSVTGWCKAWEWHSALTGLIALGAGIVCLVLHLVLPRRTDILGDDE